MTHVLFQYEKVNPMVWVYFSSLLTIALFFKFNRLWSLRNLDLICLILLAPGLVLEVLGREKGIQSVQQDGFIWLFCVGGVLLIRLLLDPMMVRRPLLEPNLNVGGMTFLGVSLMLFLMVNVATVDWKELVPGGGNDKSPAAAKSDEADKEEAPPSSEPPERKRPGYPLLWLLPSIPTQQFFEQRTADAAELARHNPKFIFASKTVIILCHLATVFGLVLIGFWHFDNIKAGVAAAVLYLMLPYMAEMTGRPDHALPAALLVWAIAMYRQPIVAGVFIGLAAGTIYFPLFLLPLWISFYWQRGLWRFTASVAVTLGLLVGGLALWADNLGVFVDDLIKMFGLWLPIPDPEGFWKVWENGRYYRWPVIALFGVLSFSFALWPAQKNLGTLMGCTAALMLGTQFWHPDGSGLYMAWYLPLLLLTIFRPNLEDRIAQSVVGQGWFSRGGADPATGMKAA